MTDNDAISSSFSPIALEIIKGTSEGAYFIMTPSGKYLSASASKKFNLISEYSSDVCDFNILFDSGNVTIKLASSDQRQIRYNYNGGSGGFRWYDGISVDPISLYKGPSVDKYMISFDSVDGGSFSSSVIKAVVGTEITLTATPDTGYEFNNDWSVKDASGSDITVADGKFTMPASNVTVAGSFTQLSYTITKTDAVGGSFVVMSGETEVSSAHYNDVITLKATPDEGYEFTSWTVTYKDGEADKSFNPNGTFNMLASDVSVSAKFTEIAKIPVYASLTELIAAGAPTEDGTQVTVTLTDEVITKFYKNGNYTNGVYFNVGNQEIMVYCRDTPSDWKVGGAVSGTLTNCKWKIYNGTWELCPDDYTELTYVAPLEPCEAPSIVLDGATATITCATDGATIYYTVGESPADPTADDAEYTSPVTLTDGQTIKAIAIKDGMLNSSVSSKKYVEGGASIVKIVSTFTDNNLNTSEKAMTWKSSISANSFESSDPSRGVQFGAAKGKFTITGTGHDSKVKKISIIISTNGTGNTISATVGGVAIGKEISLTKANNYEVVFESSSEMSGDIVFNVNDSI